MDDDDLDKCVLSDIYAALELEISIRRAYVHQKDAMEALGRLIDEVAEYFLAHDPKNIYRPEDAYFLSRLVISSIQFNSSMIDEIFSGFDNLEEDEIYVLIDVAESAFGNFYQQVKSVEETLPDSSRFWLCDLRRQSDLVTWLEWWLFINDENNRMKYALRGSYSHVGISKPICDDDGQEVGGTLFFSNPIPFTRVVTGRGSNFKIVDTAVEDVTINNVREVNKLILCVDVDKECQNFDEAVELFRSALSSRQVMIYHDTVFKEKRVPCFEPIASTPFMTQRCRNVSKLLGINRVMRKDHITPTIAGLICWDMYARQNKKLPEAIDFVINLLTDFKANKFNTPDGKYELVNKWYNDVRKKIMRH